MKRFKVIFALAIWCILVAGSCQKEEAKKEIKPLYIIHTNDTHCYIDKPLGYASVAALKSHYEAAGANVLLVDDGDFLQGDIYGGYDKGASMIALLNASYYDIATIGNHEFDYGMDVFKTRMAECEFPVVACNFYNLDASGSKTSQVCKPYHIFHFSDYDVAFVGIATPESYSKGNPKTFKDSDGNLLFSFSPTDLYDEVQKAVNDARAEGADYVVALGHLGVNSSSEPWTSYNVISNTYGIDVFIDGHSHSVISMNTSDASNMSQYAVVANSNGESVPLAQTGCYFNHIGLITMDAEGNFATALLDEYGSSDASVADISNGVVAAVDEQMGAELAESAINFSIEDEDGNRIVRKMVTNAGAITADALYYYANYVNGTGCDMAYVSGGNVRSGVASGVWTYKSCKSISPFGNDVCVIECTGQTIKDLLEWGARSAPEDEVGTIVQPAGLTYEINTSIKSSVQKNENGEWAGGPTGEYRVENIKIYDRETGAYVPLDVEKVYKVCSLDYNVVNFGDGVLMFPNDWKYEVVLTGLAVDYIAIATYVSAFKDSDGNGLPNISSSLAPFSAYPLGYESTVSSRLTFK